MSLLLQYFVPCLYVIQAGDNRVGRYVQCNTPVPEACPLDKQCLCLRRYKSSYDAASVSTYWDSTTYVAIYCLPKFLLKQFQRDSHEISENKYFIENKCS